MSERLLLIENESAVRTALFRCLDKQGYQVITALKFEEAYAFLNPDKPFNIAIVNYNPTQDSDLDFIENLITFNPKIKIILTGYQLTSQNTPDQSQSDFKNIIIANKPLVLDNILNLIANFDDQLDIYKESHDVSKNLFPFIIGESPEIRECLNLVAKVAAAEATVLITGESGSGKELIAKAIHMGSDRKNNSFVALNCGAIPSELLESELFGHVKGAFTGAIANRAGRFENADQGTLFLDEIGDLNPSLQVKILRALQEKKFEPVGSTKTLTVNTRVIAATNVNLEEAVSQGQFREDLYYRLNVIPIHVPALRERKSDIPLLLNHFLKIFNKNKKQPLSGFDQESLNCLVNYPWPGNIRELENLVERISVLKGFGLITVQDLPQKYRSQYSESFKKHDTQIPDQGLDFNSAVDQFENSLILKALEKTNWNKNQAAALLRLNRTTLVEKMKKKGLSSPLQPQGSSEALEI